MNLTEVKELLSEFDASALKKFGQNFLIDDNILNIIGKSLGENEQNVIEIGPGLGSLTRYLVKYYDNILLYEIDSKMVEVINHTIIDKTNKHIQINKGDFLKANLDNDLKSFFGDGDIYVVANLPYYITTPILLKILEEAPQIKKIVIMIQKEVAERFLGKPNTKDYNSLSVLIQTYMNTKKICDVSRNSFYPAPNVDSTVIKLERKEQLDYVINDEETFKKVNRLLFKQRRKTILNNLKEDYSKEHIEEVLNKVNISPLARSESLSVKQIIDIANNL